ncbi:MAG: 2-dehydropantoate 2-reductase [Bradyrhizobium sp.]|jgi:2-dehydropantoate 2-reductase|nr:2-dehydropantoate 2-reductase [Bradyrhizobium sp.]
MSAVLGVALPADAGDRTLDLTSHMPAAMKASMALDLDRGNRLELLWLGGKVVSNSAASSASRRRPTA